MAHKKYSEVDYNDAHSHLMGVFDNNPKLKDAAFTKEDVEGLAAILSDLREKHDDPLDVWESNKVSDYVSNLESSYEMKMGKGGKAKGEKSDWGTDILRNLIDRNLVKEEEAGDAFHDEAVDSLKGTDEDRFHAIRNLYEQDFIRDTKGDHMEEIEDYLKENEPKYEKSKRQFEKGGKAGKDKPYVPKQFKKRLEELRKELRAERISYGELAELQSLAEYIDPSDVELLEAAGVPEFPDDDDSKEKGGEVGKIASKFKPVAVKHDGDSKDGYSVLVKDKNSDFSAWVDVHISGDDVNTDWNKYIFNLKDSADVRQKSLQENTDIFDMATSEATAYLEDNGLIHQDEKGWHYGKGKKSFGGSTLGKGGKAGKDKLYVPKRIKKRLEELRKEIRKERISYGELAELQSLVEYIDPSDVELLEPAGVPEFVTEGDEVEVISGANKGIVGHITTIDEGAPFYITIKTERGHILHGLNKNQLSILSSGGSMATGGGVGEKKYGFSVGEKVLVNWYGDEDTIIGFVSPNDKENWDYGNRIVVKEHGALSLDSVKKIGSMATGGEAGKKTLKKGDSVQVLGKRWFDKPNGNTYHSVDVYVNSEFVGRSDFSYGYERQYEETGRKILEQHYNLPKGMDEMSPLWRLTDYGIKILSNVCDVARRKDLERGGKISSCCGGFWANYANDGALITGGSYMLPVEKKGFGGFLLGAGLGSIAGYVYRDQITKTKEKAKWKTMETIDRLEAGGSVYDWKNIFHDSPMSVRQSDKGRLHFDFDSGRTTGWSFDTEDVGVAAAIARGSKFLKDEKFRAIKITPAQLKETDEEDIVYWLSGGNASWRFGDQYLYDFDKTYKDLWTKDAKELKKEIQQFRTMGELMDFYQKKYMDYPYFFDDAMGNGYTRDEYTDFRDEVKYELRKISDDIDEDKTVGKNVSMIDESFGEEKSPEEVAQKIVDDNLTIKKRKKK